MPTLFATPSELEALIREQVNQVADPCALALGVTIGLTDMGLLKQVHLSPRESGYEVHLTLRLTSPDCLYFVYFEREITARLEGHPEIGTVAFTWDSCMDWTPERLSASAQEALSHRRQSAAAPG